MVTADDLDPMGELRVTTRVNGDQRQDDTTVGIMPTNEHRLPMVTATPELEKRLDGVLERAGLLQEIAA